ncbi:hypothetical protein [Bosea vestrisii]|uniref:IS66 family transposase n=1 Tax=Bosea vestrisii TaxID=151416 RepID=UPI003D7696BA
MEALIVRLRLDIEYLRREPFGSRSERKARLLDQLEMRLRISKPTPQKTSLRPKTRRSRASGRRASRSIYRERVSSSRRPRVVRAAAHGRSSSSVWTSPRRWR